MLPMKNWLATSILEDLFTKLILIAILLVISTFLSRYCEMFLYRLLKRAKVVPAMITFASELVRFGIWVLVFTIVLGVLGFSQVAFLLGGLIAVMGLVLAKSVSNVIEDLIAGVFLIFDEDIQVGSEVRYKEIAGKIVSLGIRKTKISDRKNNIHIIPNKAFDTEVVVLTGPGVAGDKRKR